MTAVEAAPPDTDRAVLEARGVTVRFGGLVALADVSIAVPPATKCLRLGRGG